MYSIIRRKLIVATACVGLGVAGAIGLAQERIGPQQPWSKWHVHDMERPVPPVVTPGTPSTSETPGKAPSDAIVLFDGTNLDAWQAKGGGEPTFTLKDGEMLSSNLNDPQNNKDLMSKQEFGDVQVHLEWAEPTPPKGSSQGRGNSGVFMMGLFETQVLDSYDNRTYADGQCGGIYGQYPPMVNACLPPGQWQTYDIFFTTPRYDADGKMTEPAFITTVQNGVLIQLHQRIEGPTNHMVVAHYPDEKLEKGPIKLQFHGNPVRYRNIWVRPIDGLEKFQLTGDVATTQPAAPAPAQESK